MPIDLKDIGAGIGGGGLLGAILTWVGFKSRIDGMEKRFEEHKKTVVYEDTFNATINPMKEDIKEISRDVKEILKNSTKRRNGDKGG